MFIMCMCILLTGSAVARALLQILPQGGGAAQGWPDLHLLQVRTTWQSACNR
jgi:hypothetical protein